MSAATKKCPYCAEEILAEAVKCKHCQSNLLENNLAEGGRPFHTPESDTPQKVVVTSHSLVDWIVGIVIAIVVAWFVGSYIKRMVFG